VQAVFFFWFAFSLFIEPLHAAPIVGVECVLDLPEPLQTSIAEPTPGLRISDIKRIWDINLYLDNDDKIMGLWAYLFPRSSNDLGFTHGMNLEVKHTRGKWVWGGKWSAELYTRMPDQVFYPERLSRSTLISYAPDGSVVQTYPTAELFEAAAVNRRAYSQFDGGRVQEMVRFIDVSRAQISARYGTRRFLDANVGVEIRNRDTLQLNIARSVQDWWHGTIRTYRYDYVSPRREAAVLGTPERFSGRATAEDVWVFFDKVTEIDRVARPEVLEEQLTQLVAPWSVSVGIRIGGQEELKTQCRCRVLLEASTGIQSESEAAQFLGPNSRATLDAGVTGESPRP